jgi:hypothetical protein
VERLKKEALLSLLAMYEVAIRDLEATNDRGVAGLIRRLERRRAEVISALGSTYWNEDA